MATIFDPDVLHGIARAALGQPIQGMIAQIARALDDRYPGHIVPERDREWVFNNAGGAMGAMLVLHASITEYVIIFGTPIGTEGHSGRFKADDWFMMLEGEHWSFAAGELERTVTRPGEMTHLSRGSAKAYRLPQGGWALEYARGAIPLMLPFGFADTVSSTLDYQGLYRTLRLYTRAVTGNLLRGKI